MLRLSMGYTSVDAHGVHSGDLSHLLVLVMAPAGFELSHFQPITSHVYMLLVGSFYVCMAQVVAVTKYLILGMVGIVPSELSFLTILILSLTIKNHTTLLIIAASLLVIACHF